MKAGKKIVNIGILLEDNKKSKAWMRDTLASDSSLDYVIEPRSVDHMFDYIRRLARQGKRIGKLVLMGHGNSTYHHIGMLQPADVDIYAMARQRKAFMRSYEDAKKEIKALQVQLKSANDETKKDLRQQLKDARDRFVNSRDNYNDSVKEHQLFRELADAMNRNAIIGLFNCYAARDAKGRAMMLNLGKIFLRKRGGQVIGCDGNIWTIHSKPVMAWLTGTEDIVAKPWGKWVRYRVRPESGRCGAPCHNFERYGYCDRPAAKNGGPCWMHR